MFFKMIRLKRKEIMLYNAISKAVNTKVTNGMVCGMAMVYFSTRMVESTMESGSSIRCKESENYTINQENWPTKVIGQTTNFQAEEFSTTSIPQWYTKP
jgi:hypothetical protein